MSAELKPGGDAEYLHAALFALHDDIYNGALRRVRAALRKLHEIETGNMDLRPAARNRIADFESIRAGLENVGRDAAALRIALIGECGCDRSCIDKNAWPK